MTSNTHAPIGSELHVCVFAMQKCARVLHAFTEFYLPFYGRRAQFLFENFDVFGCFSALVYDVDEAMEMVDETEEPWVAPLATLRSYMSQRMAVDRVIDQLFRDAAFYYHAERELRRHGRQYSFADVMKVVAVRSFDFRIMHRALVQRAQLQYDETIFNWFQPFEMLMELEDDFPTVAQDESRQTFNAICAAVGVDALNAGRLLEQQQQSLEAAIVSVANLLTPALRATAHTVFTRYREIVRRPNLAGANIEVDAKSNVVPIGEGAR